MNQMLEVFINESRELIEVASHCFLELEKAPEDKEIFNELFRAVHTIKGSSGIFEIKPLTSVVHAAEDVLDCAKDGEIILTPYSIDLLLDCLDQVNSWLNDLEDTELLSSGAVEIGAKLSKNVRTLISGTESVQQAEAQKASDANTINDVTPYEAAPSWLCHIPSAVRLALFSKNTCVFTFGEYTPDKECFFTGQDPIHEVLQLDDLQWHDAKICNEWPETELYNPFDCNLSFYFVVGTEKGPVYENFYHVAEYINTYNISPLSLISIEGEKDYAEQAEIFLDDAIDMVNEARWGSLLDGASTALEFFNPDLYQTDALRWLVAVLKSPECLENSHLPELVKALLKAIAGETFAFDSFAAQSESMVVRSNAKTSENTNDSDSQSTQPNLPVNLKVTAVNLLKSQYQGLELPVEGDIWRGRFISIATTVKRLVDTVPLNITHAQVDNALKLSIDGVSSQHLRTVVEMALVSLGEMIFSKKSIGETVLNSVDSRPSKAIEDEEVSDIGIRVTDKRLRPENDNNKAERRGQNKILKVDQARIDAMMDLVGELVVAKNALPFLARRAEEVFHCKELSREIRSQYANINRLAEEMQATVMKVRMVPVSSVFQRFPRLVRDLSRKLDKKIHLKLVGEDTEADKTVIEDLADPLIHIVRNSIDHGIESKAVRSAAGKPAEATICLQATQFDDQVLIEILDDGKGIDPNIIKNKAFEKGVIDEERLEAITDQEALQLIFEAGFSTEDIVSDLSGRGVGMDVVRTTIFNAGGTVNVESVLGESTKISLILPLSMAVTQIMMIKCAEQSYGISFESIVETVRISRFSVIKIKNNSTIVLRDRIIPIYDLRNMFDLPKYQPDVEEIALLIVKVNNEEVGIIIDDFEEGTDVILKPLEGIMSGYPLYSGTALLGDGRVLMILNLRELMLCR
jgi:two-component system chemotaxis sensor kinase CheA